MRKLDDLLLDRLFQPLCDALADRVTCFGLARSGAIGTGTLATASFLAAEPGALACLGILVWLTLMLLMLLRVAALERRAEQHRDTANDERLAAWGWRIMNATWLAFMLLRLALVPPSMSAVLMTTACAALVSALYFMACSLSPPKRRQARTGRLAMEGAR